MLTYHMLNSNKYTNCDICGILGKTIEYTLDSIIIVPFYNLKTDHVYICLDERCDQYFELLIC